MENPQTPLPGARRISTMTLLKGVLYSNLFASIAFAVAYAVTNWNEELGGILSFSEFVLVPIGMGMIAMHFWMRTERRLLRLFPYALINTVVGLAMASIFMGEGYICIIIVSPLILAFMWLGVIVAKYTFRNNTLKASTVSLLLILFIADTFSDHHYTNVVTDEITVNASPERVWEYVAQHPVNNASPDYWLFQVGLPCPIQSTVTGDHVGAERKCVFSNGATFDEVVVESRPQSVYTFDITRQPADPEIIGHIEIRRGQFILEENVDGTTKLTGKSWYRLKVYPAWYYDMWAEDITREVHLRVMRHIRDLAESEARDISPGLTD